MVVGKRTFRNIVVIAFLFFVAYAAGCPNPFIARLVHKRITVGMSADEVVTTLTKYRGYHAYRIKLLDRETLEACSKNPVFQACSKYPSPPGCRGRIPEKCVEKRYRPAEFTTIINDVANHRTDFVDFQAEISVLYMGPVFVHNSFEVDIGPDGKVKSVTPVKHWD